MKIGSHFLFENNRFFIHLYRIPPLIRTSIDCLAVSVDETNANFQFALERFANATSEADRIQILIALGCKSDKETASLYEKILSH
jgi:hypothetical protein